MCVQSKQVIYYQLQRGRMESKSIVTAYNKSSKHNAFELPKISRTILVHSEPPPFDINRYQWLTQDHDYSQMTHKQIEQEYRLLRKELLAVNDTAAKSLQMLKTQSAAKSKRPKSSDYHIQIIAQEIDNNKAILARLREELQRLMVRQKQLETNGKQGVEDQIEQTKAAIERMKQQIKEVTAKNRQFNNSWDREAKLDEEIKHLEVQRLIVDKKRQKLELKSREVKENNEKLVNQLALITEDSSKAEDMIEQELEIRKEKEEESEMESNLRHRNYQIQALQKNIQSIKNSKTLKYHQILKKVEVIANKQTKDELQINQIQQKIIISKQQLAKYQQLLKQAKSKQVTEEYEEILDQAEVTNQFHQPTQIQTQNSKNSQYSLPTQPRDNALARVNLSKKENSKSGKVYRVSSNKNKTIDVNLDISQNKQQGGNQETLLKKNTSNHRSTHKPELLKSSSKKKQTQLKDALELSQRKDIKQDKNFNVAYQKLKTWNEQTVIDEIQNKTKNKKLFNRVLINTKETEKNEQSQEITQKEPKKQRLSQVKSPQQEKKALHPIKDQANEGKQKKTIQHEKDSKNDKKQAKSLHESQTTKHKLAETQIKPKETKIAKESKPIQPKVEQKSEAKSKKSEQIGDSYIEQFQKQVQKQRQNMSKGLKLVISLNDVQSSLKNKSSFKKANKYDSIEQQIINEQQQVLE